jgi:hypothetical protein
MNKGQEFCIKHGIGEFLVDPHTKVIDVHFYEHDFHLLTELKVLFSCLDGGLVLGKLHSEGGIHVIHLFNEEKLHGKLTAEIEGWEYVTAPIKSIVTEMEIKTINDSIKCTTEDIDTSFNIPPACNIIDTREAEVAFVVFSPLNHFVINRNATKVHIDKILEIENKNVC